MQDFIDFAMPLLTLQLLRMCANVNSNCNDILYPRAFAQCAKEGALGQECFKDHFVLYLSTEFPIYFCYHIRTSFFSLQGVCFVGNNTPNLVPHTARATLQMKASIFNGVKL